MPDTAESLAQRLRGRQRSLLKTLALISLFLALGVIVFATQNNKLGFERGHHGWVSSHVLAIAQNASPENGFVGYAVQSRDASGQIQYHYFDRYPVPFSATLHLLVKTAPDLAASIYFSRQFMNAIFLLNLVFAYLLLSRLTGDPVLSLSASLLAFSGYYFMFFKDMVHFDQPAILGVTLLLYAIVLHEQTRRKWPVYAATVIAVSMGRAYPAMAVLGLWLLFEVFRTVHAQSWRPFRAAKVLARSQPPWVFFLGLVLSATYLSYNVYMESVVRDVPITETSIVNSAQRRLGSNTAFAAERAVPLTWRLHAQVQAERLVVGAIPYPFGVPVEYKRSVEYLVKRAGLPVVLLLLAVGAALIVRYIFKQPTHSRRLWILISLSGFAWVIPMKNLTLPHHYTTLYHLGLFLAFFTALVSLFPYRARPFLLASTLAVFLLSNSSVNSIHNLAAEDANTITADFQRIRNFLEPGQNIHIHAPGERHLDGSVAIVPGAPYAAAFYLQRHYFTSAEQALFSISRDPHSLCPDDIECDLVSLGNHKIHLGQIRQEN